MGRPAGEEWSQNVGTLTIKRTSTGGFGVTTETSEAIHFQVMTSNVSVIHAKSSPPNTITSKSGRSEGATNNVEVLAQDGSAVTGGKESGVVCLARAAAFAAGREHTFPIEECAEHCYCVFKGWT